VPPAESFVVEGMFSDHDLPIAGATCDKTLCLRGVNFKVRWKVTQFEKGRSATWEGREVPAVLRAGHHGEVARWRREQQLRRTLARRPDLLAHAELSPSDRAFLATIGWIANNGSG